MFTSAVVIVIGLSGCFSQSINIRPYKDLLLNLHNDYRREVSPKAANMQQMSWDNTLAREAAAWVATCDFEHQQKGRGENLAFNTATTGNNALIEHSLKAWYDEKELYTLGTQSCGRACHYTQMVWASSTKVGCGIKRCPSIKAFGRNIRSAWYIACFYDPQGNWIGEKPYSPGRPCSQCLNGQSCNDGLCSGKGKVPCVDGHSNCESWEERGECTRNPKWMLKNCKKSCKVCQADEESNEIENETTDENEVIGGVEHAICRNKAETTLCRTWKSTGACRHAYKHMKEWCQKECSYCTATAATPACANRFSDKRCKTAKKTGKCQRTPKYMKKWCQKECSFCTGVAAAAVPCEDKLECCRELGRTDYCTNYRKFMNDNCRKTCSLC